MEHILYVDMDGTLAEFRSVSIAELYMEGYFRELAPQENVVEAVRRLRSKPNGIQVRLLSCYLKDSKFALKEKQEWLRRHIPELSADALFLPCGISKAGFVSKDGFLLDDFTDNLLVWEESGKKGIKLYNNINGTKGRWKGFSVNAASSPDLIASSIEKFMAL